MERLAAAGLTDTRDLVILTRYAARAATWTDMSCGSDRRRLWGQGADPRERRFRLLAGARAADDRQHADRTLQMTLAVGRSAQLGQQVTLDTINLGGHRGRART